MQMVLLAATSMMSFGLLAQTVDVEKLYDFDEKVHYQQTKLAPNHYRVEVRPDDYKHFKRQSAFLLRHAANLCRSSQYTLKVLGGVQKYERFPTEPRAYPGSLIAEVICELPKQ